MYILSLTNSIYCTYQPRPLVADPLSKYYSELQARLAAASQNVDLGAWNVNTFMNRYTLVLLTIKIQYSTELVYHIYLSMTYLLVFHTKTNFSASASQSHFS